ncbi:MAG TPA: hypothetical protein PLU50_10855, partial [Pseudobdellovibrionaceae bacterium]|nr:hypothetical protein [Pseudobdellovibrionaceae bacterium]
GVIILFSMVGTWGAMAEEPCHLESMSAETVIKIPVDFTVQAGVWGYLVAPVQKFESNYSIDAIISASEERRRLDVKEDGTSTCSISFNPSNVSQVMRGTLKFRAGSWIRNKNFDGIISSNYDEAVIGASVSLQATETRLNSRPVNVNLHCGIQIKRTELGFSGLVRELDDLSYQSFKRKDYKSEYKFNQDKKRAMEEYGDRVFDRHQSQKDLCLYKTLVDSLKNASLGGGPGTIEFEDRPFKR